MEKTFRVLMYSLKPEVDRLHRSGSASSLSGFIGAAILVVAVVTLFLSGAFGLTEIGLDPDRWSFWAIVWAFLSGAGLYGLFKIVKAFRASQIRFNIRLNCPNCKKYIPAFDPWMCPSCDKIDDVPARIKENNAARAHFKAVVETKDNLTLGDIELPERVKAYTFLYQCPTCASVATTFKCHNCSEVIALREPADPNRFAYNPKLLPGGVFVENDLKSKVSEPERKSKHREINEALRQLNVKDEFLDLDADRVEHYKRKVDDGQMSEEEAQEHLRVERLFLKRRRPLG